MKKRLCIIGFGGMGYGFHYHQTVDHDLIELAGIYDIAESRVEKAKKKGIYTYSSLEEVLNDKTVDLVTIATPNDSHLEIAVKCLEAGKNVICEKPVTMSCAEYRIMVDAAKKAGKMLMVHQNRRWDADYLAMKKIYESGEIGTVFNIESRVHGSRGVPGDWRNLKTPGGGMILDWGVHMLDQMLLLVPEDVISVYCTTSHVTSDEVDDGFKLEMHFENGVDALIDLGTLNFISMPRFYMQGTTGTAILKDWSDNIQVGSCREWYEKEVKPVLAGSGLTKTMAPRDDVTLDEYEIELPKSDVYDFYRNAVDVIEGKAEQFIKHEEVMRVLKVIEASFESDRLGMPVAFKEDC